MADAVNLQQSLRLRILGLAELLDLPVVLLDLDGHLRDLLKYRTERLCQSRRHNNYTEWHFDEAQAFTKDEVGVLETNLFSQTAPGFKNRALVVLVGYFGEAQQAKSLL